MTSLKILVSHSINKIQPYYKEYWLIYVNIVIWFGFYFKVDNVSNHNVMIWHRSGYLTSVEHLWKASVIVQKSSTAPRRRGYMGMLKMRI